MSHHQPRPPQSRARKVQVTYESRPGARTASAEAARRREADLQIPPTATSWRKGPGGTARPPSLDEEPELMRLIGLLHVVGPAALVSASPTLSADMMSTAKTELTTALTHGITRAARHSRRGGTPSPPRGELPRGLVWQELQSAGRERLSGTGERHFRRPQGFWHGGSPHDALAEIADQIANWGIEQTMATDIGRAQAAATAAEAVIQLAIDNLK